MNLMNTTGVVVAEVRKQTLQYFFQVRTLFWNMMLPFVEVTTFYFMYLPFVGRDILLSVEPSVDLPIIGFLVAGQVIYNAYTNTLLAGNFFDAEREQGTLEIMLLTPASRFAVLLGSGLAGLLLNIWMFVSIVLLVAFTPFVSINVHDPVAVFSSFFLSAFSLLGLGMCFGCVAVLTREGGAIFVSVQEPIDFLSGLRFPVRILPGVLQAVASILPLTYGIHAARLSLIGGETILRIWFDLLAMAIMGLSFMLFSQYLIALIERRAKKEGTLSLF